jgi:hypothetical protein
MTTLSLSSDAATVLGLAGTAVAFALSIDDEVERWLRPLRLYGDSGAVLQEMGVSEARVEGSVEVATRQSSSSPEETLHIITMAASELAADRGAPSAKARTGKRSTAPSCPNSGTALTPSSASTT